MRVSARVHLIYNMAAWSREMAPVSRSLRRCEEVLDNLLDLAAPALAKESLYCDRVERRRSRRWKKLSREGPERRRFANLSRLART